MVRQGMGHITVDGYTLSQVQTYVEQAKTGKTALQIMLHPSRLNTEGYMTAATFLSVLEYIKAEETAGRLTVISPYEHAHRRCLKAATTQRPPTLHTRVGVFCR